MINIISGNSEYLSVVNDKYEEKAILSVLFSFADIFQEVKRGLEELSKENKNDDNLLEYIHFRYRMFYYDEFYTQTYFHQNSIKILFQELTIEKIKTLCKNYKIPEKSLAKLVGVFNEYLNQNPSFKNKIDKLIFAENDSI